MSVSIQAPAPRLSEYMDYREYLQAWYEHRLLSSAPVDGDATTRARRKYSYALFAAAADFKSPNYLRLIIEGKRNLSAQMMAKFAKALRLSRAEAEEFRLLAFYNQSTDADERSQMLKQLSEHRAQQMLEQGQISAESWEKVPSWLGWVLFAMSDQRGVDFNSESLQTLIRRPIRNEELKRSIERLLSNEELERHPQTGQLIKPRLQKNTAALHLPAELIRKLQSELIELGMESLFRDEPQEREFGTLTLCLTEKEFEALRFELRQFRKRWHKEISVNRLKNPGERVYQMNVQLFPLTDAVTESHGERQHNLEPSVVTQPAPQQHLGKATTPQHIPPPASASPNTAPMPTPQPPAPTEGIKEL